MRPCLTFLTGDLAKKIAFVRGRARGGGGIGIIFFPVQGLSKRRSLLSFPGIWDREKFFLRGEGRRKEIVSVLMDFIFRCSIPTFYFFVGQQSVSRMCAFFYCLFIAVIFGENQSFNPPLIEEENSKSSIWEISVYLSALISIE